MSKSFGDGWATTELPADKLHLDPRNPRLDLKTDSTQDEIRKALIIHEDVVNLAITIANRGAMLPGERIIVTREHGQNVVLEGNRRTAAVQILRKPELLSKTDQKRLPKIPPALRARLARLPVDVAPTRISAEPILTKRHTERGVRPWSTLANMRRVYRYYESGSTLEEIKTVLSISKARATQLVRGYKLFEVARKSSGWTVEEKNVLDDPKLVTSGFTRFFTLKDARVRLGLGYDDQQNPTSKLTKSEFTALVQKIARGFLIAPEGSKPPFDTRSTVEEVLDGKARKSKEESKDSGSKASVVKTPTASDFFENLRCAVQDDHLIKLTDELRKVNYRLAPISASMLLRATFECTLAYQIKKKGAWAPLVASRKGKDPNLDAMVSCCAQDANNIFTERRICTLLSNHSTKEAVDYLNLVTHGRWAEADPAMLKSVATRLRKVITAILEDSQ